MTDSTLSKNAQRKNKTRQNKASHHNPLVGSVFG